MKLIMLICVFVDVCSGLRGLLSGEESGLDVFISYFAFAAAGFCLWVYLKL